MKKMISLMIILTLLSVPTLVFADNHQKKITPDQQQELNELRRQIFELKKQMIEKHVEFGIIDRKEADNWLKKIEKSHKRFKDVGYIPCKERMKNKGHPEHDIMTTP
ncbi:YckD family protein [Microaerobacter geothermalis]|uniref:DUF2680 domain-containing protein n=1 Tax=Microaerobacter geothermalis TaxID=674972 RepID=UPI001F2E529F|nr:DUF2680 domain-containing protein [Microaerobacter geothermalis]MCF6094713.1 YckD family protein [Microaerobacter geothermalis]